MIKKFKKKLAKILKMKQKISTIFSYLGRMENQVKIQHLWISIKFSSFER